LRSASDIQEAGKGLEQLIRELIVKPD
jgi:hypothetical protein